MAGSVIHVYHERAASIRERILRAAPEREVVAWTEPAQLRDGLAEVEVLFAPRPPRAGWAAARRLRLIQLLGAGVDPLLPSPDLPEAVEVAGVRGLFAAEVAEHALAMMLALAHGLAGFVAQQRARTWKPRPVGRLDGRTVAVLGLGEVGARVARAAAALGMRVVGVSRGARPVADVDEVLAVDRLGDALAAADHVVVALPRTPATERLLDADQLARLPAGAFLVNVARGGIVDEAALLDALRAGRLAGAALDVFAEEPLPPGSPLWDAPNTILTPHIAGHGERYVERCVEVLLDNVGRLERGAPRLQLVDRARGY